MSETNETLPDGKCWRFIRKDGERVRVAMDIPRAAVVRVEPKKVGEDDALRVFIDNPGAAFMVGDEARVSGKPGAGGVCGVDRRDPAHITVFPSSDFDPAPGDTITIA